MLQYTQYVRISHRSDVLKLNVDARVRSHVLLCAVVAAEQDLVAQYFVLAKTTLNA